MERATWVIAAFTIVLAVATTWNIWITQGLLKQSKEALEQSKGRFFFDITDRLMNYVIQHKLIDMEAAVKHCKNRLLILARINLQEAERIWEALKIWGGEKRHINESTFGEYAEKEDPDFKEKIDRVKAGKEIKIEE